jgi:hypothetical protein
MFNIFLRVFASEDTQFQNAKRYAMEIFMFDSVSPELLHNILVSMFKNLSNFEKL